jgi:hypothetical protein
MSKIQKVAVYDARLIQDEPVYAVQKGALSVSVASFAAISASASQLTFQILVPSLNVFVDRKIQLNTPLSWNANVFYTGPHQQSHFAWFTIAFTPVAGQTDYTGVTFTTIGGASVPNVPQQGIPVLYVSTGVVQYGTTLLAANISGATMTLSRAPTGTTATTLLFATPVVWDVPDIAMSSGGSFDGGYSGISSEGPGAALGYCTAVGPKDLSYCSFPVQSALTNMTATLNDCTVTTNGDTLREQLMLTQTPENFKQRTTPTNMDSFAWGRDDANNNSGNFSSYGVTNNYGDIPNGAFPTTWNSNPGCSVPLQSPQTSLAPGQGVGTYPFLNAGSTVYGFYTGLLTQGTSGVGFYVQQLASQVTGAVTTPTLVPVINNQPVWTTGFAGGDLFGWTVGATTGTNAFGTTLPAAQFTIPISSNILTLCTAVSPYSMIGARLYDAGAATGWNYQAAPAALTTTGSQTGGVYGIVSSLITGELGQPGSTYGLTLSLSANVGTGKRVWGLSGGCPIQQPLPVFGTVNVVEPLIISPLIWADSAEFQSVGLYGMTNMSFVMNFAATLGTTQAVLNPYGGIGALAASATPYWLDNLKIASSNFGNIVRSSNIRSCISDLQFATQTTGLSGPWTGTNISNGALTSTPTLYATFLTPSPDTPLPALSTVPYVEFPRYLKTDTVSMNSTAPVVTSQTISLTSIPDYVMIYIKPATRGPSQLDQYLPVSRVSVTFDNYSNLCSGFQQFNLYESAVAAGLPMDWHQWRGFTQGNTPSIAIGGNVDAASQTYTQSGFTQLSGGPILLRMGHDITLQPGLAPGCLGNFSFQVTLTVDNSKGYFSYIGSSGVVLTIIAINSGFFETVRGQSAIRKTILDMADVEAATPDSGISKTHLNRMIGRGWGSSMSNMMSKGLSHLKKAKEVNDRFHLTDLARTYGGDTGRALANGADQVMSYADGMGSGHHKRHRGSGIAGL